MKVLYCEVGGVTEIRETSGSLSDMQELVGGYVESVGLGNDFLLLCNEEGKIQGLQANKNVVDTSGKVVDLICGNFVICKSDLLKGEWVGLEEADIETAKSLILKISDTEIDKILTLWSKKQSAGSKLPCPRCGKDMKDDMITNSLSRHRDIYICDECGTLEAMLDYHRATQSFLRPSQLPIDFQNWFAIQFYIMTKGDLK